MPRIQLLRRDSSVIELDASDITIGLNRLALTYPIPILATRMGLDLNQTDVEIVLSGIIVDDEEATGGVGAAFSMDLSRAGGTTLAPTWFSQYASISALKADLDGVRVTFSSLGQNTAGLGEDITLELKNGSASSSGTTNRIIGVNISGGATTEAIADLIVAGLNGASSGIKMGGVDKAFTDLFTITQSEGVMDGLSEDLQSGEDTFDGEFITIRNTAVGVQGDSAVTVSKGQVGQSWVNQFIVSNLRGGQPSQKESMGDKVQNILNMANMSAGGALISPQVITGSVIDLPDSVSSLDTSRFLRIDEAAVVKKYVVGIRIPYESLASSTTGNRVLRQFLLPAGPGTDYSAERNDNIYDPTVIVDNQTIRPNPFLEQGVAIPAVIISFNPSYEAGDGFWTYDLTMKAVEQLVGL